MRHSAAALRTPARSEPKRAFVVLVDDDKHALPRSTLYRDRTQAERAIAGKPGARLREVTIL